MEDWMDDYAQMIADCIKREPRMSEWEQGFIQSINDQVNRGKSLTPNQISKLNSIWEKVTEKG